MKSSPNRLIHETSPYLLQHAHNPVDWHPWSNEAFEKARVEKKPVLLSIGYSACHWCHVMERESFEDEAIAEIMNGSFVNIKVDREERPDIDQIYQSAVSFFIRRGGGWPLTMFLTPDRIPFYGGTYFPPNDRYGIPGFPKILQEVSSVYQTRQADIAQTTTEVQKALTRLSTHPTTGETINPDILALSVKSLSMLFDSTYGGFGAAPKFPSTPSLMLFLRHAHQTGDSLSLHQVTHTLGQMAWGGIYDQLGGGFHRYSTDARWLVPHFEKMLYDNAQLATLYFETYQATGQPFYLKIGEEILDYVLREMTDPSGGFYSTQDADSEQEEGRFFTWRSDDIQSTLDEPERALILRYYGITPTGNFEGRNILWIARPLESVAQEIGLSLKEADARLAEGKKKLLVQREERIKPFRDEKIITSLNGLMISGFVYGYQVTRKKRYLDAAICATDFILNTLYKDGRLLHTFKDGLAKLSGYLDDYAYFINALLDLDQAMPESRYMDAAQLLAARLTDLFWDNTQGGFFFTSHDHDPIIAQYKPYTDQSVPSGNAVAALALIKLFSLTGDQTYFDKAEKTLRLFVTAMEENPFATGSLIVTADLYLRGITEITVYGKQDSPEIEDILSSMHKLFLPHKVIRRVEGSIPNGPPALSGKPAVVICKNQTCSAPLTTWEEIYAVLGTS